MRSFKSGVVLLSMTDTPVVPNSASVSFMLDEESFAALRIQAKTNNRTVSGELRALVHASIRPSYVLNPSPWGHGYLQPYTSHNTPSVTGNVTYTASTEGEASE